MSLIDVVDAVRGEFERRQCPAPVHFGNDFLDRFDEPNRVVFVPSPRKDTFAPPMPAQNAGSMPQTILNWQPGINPRPLYTRQVFGEAHIWAAAPIDHDPVRQMRADQLALDALLNMTCACIRFVVVGYETMSGGIQTPDQATARGLVYVLEFAIAIPIIDLPLFSPGYLDEASRTYPEKEIDVVQANVEQIDLDGNTVETTSFDVGEP